MVCQNQSIDDSDAPLARDLRILVRERLQAGDSNSQVLDFLVQRYGEFVLYLRTVMAGPVGQDLTRQLVEKRGLRFLGTTYYGVRHVTTSRKAVRTVADMKEFKLRVPENDVFLAMARAWGAKPTPMAFGELYLALRQNVVDGQENPLPTIDSGKFHEVQKYLVLTGHILTPRMVIIHEPTWKGLSPAEQTALRDAVAEGIAWQDAEIQVGSAPSSTSSRPPGWR